MVFSSTTQLLGIFVFYHAVWLDGMTYARHHGGTEGFGFGATPIATSTAPTATGFGFGSTQPTGQPANTGFGFGTTATSVAPATGFGGFGAAPAASSGATDACVDISPNCAVNTHLCHTSFVAGRCKRTCNLCRRVFAVGKDGMTDARSYGNEEDEGCLDPILPEEFPIGFKGYYLCHQMECKSDKTWQPTGERLLNCPVGEVKCWDWHQDAAVPVNSVIIHKNIQYTCTEKDWEKTIRDPSLDTIQTLEEMSAIQAEEDAALHRMKRSQNLSGTDSIDYGNAEGITTLCGADFETELGTITHPEPPAKNYKNNERCIWTISSSVPLYFYFSKFNMESQYDIILARDGYTIDSPELGRYSGKSLYQTFVTEGDAHIMFVSDVNVVGQGFVLHWRIYSAEEQCKAKDGTCLQTGNTCDSIITLIENSCEDNCTCCEGKV